MPSLSSLFEKQENIDFVVKNCLTKTINYTTRQANQLKLLPKKIQKQETLIHSMT